MFLRPAALLTLAALALLDVSPVFAATTKPTPKATPLKTITHIYSSALCTGLRRAIFPAVGHVLQDDRIIAASRPMFRDFVKQSTISGGQAGQDMAVMHLEQLITPMVQNTEAIERSLNDPIFLQRTKDDSNKQLLQMRAHLEDVLAEQKHALDLVSGFVDTQQLGEIQAAGNDVNKAISQSDTTRQNGQNGQSNSNSNGTSPTPPPSSVLNAGISDPMRKYDPRFTETGSTLGYNPLNAFDQQMGYYQQTIDTSEGKASKLILAAVPLCGGKVPPPDQPAGSPPAAPSPAPSGPAGPSVILPSTAPSPKP
jgi:hypothetical protein